MKRLRVQSLDNNIQAFLALVRAGLWETDVQLLQYGRIDFKEIYRLAEEQSVVGLVAAGIEHVVDCKIPKENLLQFVGQALQLEQRNLSMNLFVAEIVNKLREKDIYSLLVKGQGVAQCYERPLWRSCGDIDLLLSNDNYFAAKGFLSSIADEVANEDSSKKHLALVINGFDVELHGKMPFGLSKRVDKGIDDVLNNLFYGGNVRSWMNNKTMVFLPSPDNDVILVFTHFLHHFFIEGVGLRQICDWCRLLWTYRETLNRTLLESRIRKMGLLTEWKTFGALAVEYLGMPEEAMPLFNINDNHNAYFKKKAEKVLKRVLKTGNFGHNNDLSYRSKYKGVSYKLVAAWRRLWEFVTLTPVFPMDAPKYYMTYILGKIL